MCANVLQGRMTCNNSYYKAGFPNKTASLCNTSITASSSAAPQELMVYQCPKSKRVPRIAVFMCPCRVFVSNLTLVVTVEVHRSSMILTTGLYCYFGMTIGTKYVLQLYPLLLRSSQSFLWLLLLNKFLIVDHVTVSSPTHLKNATSEELPSHHTLILLPSHHNVVCHSIVSIISTLGCLYESK